MPHSETMKVGNGQWIARVYYCPLSTAHCPLFPEENGYEIKQANDIPDSGMRRIVRRDCIRTNHEWRNFWNPARPPRRRPRRRHSEDQECGNRRDARDEDRLDRVLSGNGPGVRPL